MTILTQNEFLESVRAYYLFTKEKINLAVQIYWQNNGKAYGDVKLQDNIFRLFMNLTYSEFK